MGALLLIRTACLVLNKKETGQCYVLSIIPNVKPPSKMRFTHPGTKKNDFNFADIRKIIAFYNRKRVRIYIWLYVINRANKLSLNSLKHATWPQYG